MTDRFSALTVALETDIREDDAQALIAAIKQLKGVLDVIPMVGEYGMWVYGDRVRREILRDILDLVQENEVRGRCDADSS